MIRDYKNFSERVKRLTKDVYTQPPDAGHSAWALNAVEWIASTIYVDKKPGEYEGKVLDVGCGHAFMCPVFEALGLEWTGVTIGEDFRQAQANMEIWNKPFSSVHENDMTFLPFEDGEFDLIFARHVLEHSPFPIITLMEWRRVVKDDGYLCLVAPAPHWWTSRGRNHYSIVEMELLKWWCERAGWKKEHKYVFNNREPLFLDHLAIYAEEYVRYGREKAQKVLEAYPPGPVEFRLICKAGEEVTE